MIGTWLKNIGDAMGDALNGTPLDASSALDVERLSTHLLVEVARADYGIDDVELASIREAIEKTTRLAPEEIESIIKQACEEVETAVSYHEHIKVINDSFDREQKCLLVEQMWRVAFADNELDRYEEAFIRRFSDLIYLKHRDFMQTKHRAQS